MSSEQSALAIFVRRAPGPGYTVGLVLFIKSVYFPFVELGGLSLQVQATMFCELATHHALGEGLVIWKVARVVPTRVLMTAKKASRELNIFLLR